MKPSYLRAFVVGRRRAFVVLGSVIIQRTESLEGAKLLGRIA